MKTHHFKLGIILVTFAFFTNLTHALTPQSEFDDLYGQKMHAVTNTRDKTDDINLAEELIESAQLAKDKKLAALLCNKAHELTAKITPDGLNLAIQAIDLLPTFDPSQTEPAIAKSIMLRKRMLALSRGKDKIEAKENLLSFYLDIAAQFDSRSQFTDAMQYYRMATALMPFTDPRKKSTLEIIQDITFKSSLDSKITSLKAKIKKNPNNAKSKNELFKIYVIELDDPATARKFSFLFDSIENATEHLTLATTPIAELDGDQSFELATWYYDTLYTSNPATNTSKAAMLIRAKKYYKHFLAVYDIKDLKQKRATDALDKIIPLLDELNPNHDVIASDDGSINLLEMIDLRKHPIAGKWALQKNILSNEHPYPVPGKAIIAFPVMPTGSYKLNFKLRRMLNKGQGIWLKLPVGNNAFTVRMFINSMGLSDIKNKPQDNYAGATGNVKKLYDFTVTVNNRKGKISVNISLDDKENVLTWKGTYLDCMLKPEAPNVIKLTTTSPFIYESIKLTAITGKILTTKHVFTSQTK